MNSNGLIIIESGIVKVFLLLLLLLIGKSWAAKTLNIQIYACAKHIQQGFKQEIGFALPTYVKCIYDI